MGWKVVTIIGAHGWGQPKKTLRTVDGPVPRIVIVIRLANLNIQKSLKHSNTRRGKAQLSTRAPCSVRTQKAASHRQQDWTELSFASSCTWTNKYKLQFKQTEKDVKESNSAPAHSVLCTQGARRETCLQSLEHRICLFLLLYRHIQDYVKIPVLESILEKTVGYVLSQSNQLRMKLDVHHYIGCIVS